MATGVVVPLDGRVRAAFVARARARWPHMLPRQATVLYLACTGRTSEKEMAATLRLLRKTVQLYRSEAFAALGVADLTHAVARVWPLFVAAERTARIAAARHQEAA